MISKKLFKICSVFQGFLFDRTQHNGLSAIVVWRFIPRREIRSISLGVQLILFPFIRVSKSLEPFENLLGFSIFFPSKCFIPRREIRSISLGVQLILFPFIPRTEIRSITKGPIVFTCHFLG